MEGKKQPGKRKPYQPKIEVVASTSKSISGTMGLGLFLGTDKFHEEQNRWPTAEEISKLSDWLQVGPGDDFEGVRIKDDGRSALGEGVVRLIKSLDNTVARNTTMACNETHGVEHLDRVESQARKYMQSAEGIGFTTKTREDGSTYLDKESLDKINAQFAKDRSRQDAEPPKKKRKLGKQLTSDSNGSVDFSGGALQRVRRLADWKKADGSDDEEALDASTPGGNPTTAPKGKRNKAGATGSAKETGPGKSAAGKSSARKQEQHWCEDRGLPGCVGQAARGVQQRKTTEDSAAVGAGKTVGQPNTGTKKNIKEARPLAPWEKKIARQGKKQLYDKFVLDYQQKEVNFSEAPGNKDVMASVFEGAAEKKSKIVDARFYEAWKESDATMSSEASDMVHDLDVKCGKLQVMANMLSCFKAKEGEALYLCAMIMQQIEAVLAAGIPISLEVYREVVKRGFGEYLTNEEWKYCKAIVFDEARSPTFSAIGATGQCTVKQLLDKGMSVEDALNLTQDLFGRMVSHYGWKPDAVAPHIQQVKELVADEGLFASPHIPGGSLPLLKDILLALEWAEESGTDRKLALLENAHKAKDRLRSNTSKAARQFCTLPLGRPVMLRLDAWIDGWMNGWIDHRD